MDNVELVKRFLKAQNLEQLGRRDEAVELYEQAVAAGFDATGPYDRLISLYGDQALHGEVIRVAGSALANVQTHTEKRGWYARVRAEAEKALPRVPEAAPRRERDERSAKDMPVAEGDAIPPSAEPWRSREQDE